MISRSQGLERYLYWTEPDEYTLTARFETAVSPAAGASPSRESEVGQFSVISEPVRIHVVR